MPQTFLTACVLRRCAVCCPHDEEVDNHNDEDAVLCVYAESVMEGVVEEDELQDASWKATQPSQCSTQDLLAGAEMNIRSLGEAIPFVPCSCLAKI